MARDAQVVEFENSSDFANIEEAERFANVVQTFMLTGKLPTAAGNAGKKGES